MFRLAILLPLLILFISAAPAHASDCQFVLGFKAFRDQYGHEIVGDCVENERHSATGAAQLTTNGYLFWDRERNVIYFEPHPAPSPTPTLAPTPRPHVIDSAFSAALDALRRSGPWGEYWYDYVFWRKIDIEFDPGDQCDEGFILCAYPYLDTIFVTREYYNRAQTNILASYMVHEIAHFEWFADNDITTAEECFENEAYAVQAEVDWLVERYGEDRAKQMTARVRAVYAGTLMEYVRAQPSWQRFCSQWPGAQPTPVPTHIQSRTGCTVQGTDTRLFNRVLNFGVNRGIARWFMDTHVRPHLAYAVALEAQYTAAARAFPDWNGNPVVSSWRFCDLVASSERYRIFAANAIER